MFLSLLSPSAWGRRVHGVLLALAMALMVTASTAMPAAQAAVDDPVNVVTYNVCGNSTCRADTDTATWTNAMVQEITTRNADVVALQELCFGQWAALRTALPGYTLLWTSTLATAPNCGAWAADGDARFGLGIAVKAPSADRLVASVTVPAGEEPRSVLCARATLAGRLTLACDTHLASYSGADNGAGQVMAKMEEWGSGLPLILAGDFNAVPRTLTWDTVKAGTPSSGAMSELDENDKLFFPADCRTANVTSCSSGELTATDGVKKKIDWIMVSGAHWKSVSADAVEPGLSDHRLLWGTAHVE